MVMPCLPARQWRRAEPPCGAASAARHLLAREQTLTINSTSHRALCDDGRAFLTAGARGDQLQLLWTIDLRRLFVPEHLTVAGIRGRPKANRSHEPSPLDLVRTTVHFLRGRSFRAP